MIMKNKKGQLGPMLAVIITLVFFLALYPFWQSMFNAAEGVHTGFLADVIGFIPFLVWLMVIVKVINLDSSGAQ